MIQKLKNFIYLLYVLFYITSIYHCKAKKEDNHRVSVPLKVQVIKNKKMNLKIIPRWFFDPDNTYTHSKKKEWKQRFFDITQSLHNLILIVIEKTPQKLKFLVHKKDGVYVDLKAHWTYNRLQKEIISGKGYLYESFLALENFFLFQEEIQIDYYISDTQCELKISSIKKSKKGKKETELEIFQLNNPIFIYRKNKWYVYRLF